MNKQAFSSRRDPLLVEYENVPFHRGPGEQGHLCRVKCIVDEDPDKIECSAEEHRCAIVTEVENAWNIGELVHKADHQYDNDDMIVKGSAESSIDEKAVEDE